MGKCMHWEPCVNDFAERVELNIGESVSSVDEGYAEKMEMCP